MKEKHEIIQSLAASKGAIDSFMAWLELELEESRLEMESASSEMAIWRAQGRILEIRSLLGVLKKLS